MHKVLIFAACLVTTTVAASPSMAAPAPCEDMLAKVKAALQAAKLGDADSSKVTDLENKGIERCKADDDARADSFFQQALDLIGK